MFIRKPVTITTILFATALGGCASMVEQLPGGNSDIRIENGETAATPALRCFREHMVGHPSPIFAVDPASYTAHARDRQAPYNPDVSALAAADLPIYVMNALREAGLPQVDLVGGIGSTKTRPHYTIGVYVSQFDQAVESASSSLVLEVTGFGYSYYVTKASVTGILTDEWGRVLDSRTVEATVKSRAFRAGGLWSTVVLPGSLDTTVKKNAELNRALRQAAEIATLKLAAAAAHQPESPCLDSNVAETYESPAMAPPPPPPPPAPKPKPRRGR